MNKPIYEIKIDENELGVSAVSFVDSPAIESDFLFFNKEETKPLLFSKEMERIALGCVLIPDKLIYRVRDGFEYYVKFSKETIKQIRNKYLTNTEMRFNIQHSSEDMIYDLGIVESYILSEHLKDDRFDLPEGSWIVGVKINDERLWSMVQKGEVKGFSVEGLFELSPVKEIKLSEIKPMSIFEKFKQFILTDKDVLKEVSEEFEQTQVDLMTKIDEMTKEIEVLNSVIANKENEISILMSDKESLKFENEMLKSKLAEYEIRESDMQKEIDVVREENISLKSELSKPAVDKINFSKVLSGGNKTPKTVGEMLIQKYSN
jgi:regulator of replication initiation timing